MDHRNEVNPKVFFVALNNLWNFLSIYPTPYTPIVETSMYKGIETSVGCPYPYTHPYLTLHSDVIIIKGNVRMLKESR